MRNITEYIKVNEARAAFDWDDEANKDGKIEVTTSIMGSGGRESYETHWEIERLEDYDDYWGVRATVVKTELPRKYKKGWYIDFELSKDTEIWDIDSILVDEIENERIAAWSSGH